MKQIRVKQIGCVLGSLLLLLLCGFAPNSDTVPKLMNTQEYPVSVLSGVEARYAADQLILLESETDKIVLKEYCSYTSSGYHATVSTVDNILKIEGGDRPHGTSYSSYIELYIPKGFSGTIRLNTASGSIESSNTSFQGPVSLCSASGNILLNQVDFALDCNTASGVIQAQGSELCGNVATTSGSIAVHTGTLGGDLELSSVSGSVEVTLSAADSFRLNASTVSGKITDAFHQSFAGKKQSAANGPDPVHTIDITTVSGTIEILKD